LDVDKDIMEGIASAALHPNTIEAGESYATLDLIEKMPSSLPGLTLGQTEEGSKFLQAKREEVGEEIVRIRKEQERIKKERRQEAVTAAVQEAFPRILQSQN